MAISYVDSSELDEYLMMPDCPECGSEDVVCMETYQDGERVIKQYLCNKCGHVWTERTKA